MLPRHVISSTKGHPRNREQVAWHPVFHFSLCIPVTVIVVIALSINVNGTRLVSLRAQAKPQKRTRTRKRMGTYIHTHTSACRVIYTVVQPCIPCDVRHSNNYIFTRTCTSKLYIQHYASTTTVSLHMFVCRYLC